MRLFMLFIAALALALSLGISVVIAEPSCTCSKQTDGSTWCTCVGDDGKTYCMSCPANGGACTRVSCDS
ncbi:MAG: hypothetical protein JRJ87_25880 [Deltaproteobacteria bacterium]|nr:hypothetical protein [Deltaproteobacteria bacterium]